MIRLWKTCSVMLLAFALSLLLACGGGSGNDGGDGDGGTGGTGGSTGSGSVDSDNDGYVNSVDVDDDNDGLIEIDSLEKLDWMRYDLAGTSLTDNLGNVDATGCPVDGCRGYELIADLDFDTNGDGNITGDDDYTDYDDDGSNSGWLPIGSASEPYAADFEGNNQVIRNLFIDRSTPTSLFGSIDGATHPDAHVEIRNLSILDAQIVGGSGTGVLASYLYATHITNCHVSGNVFGNYEVIGGLAGGAYNGSHIATSSAVVDIEGTLSVGALVGSIGASTAPVTVESSTASGTVRASLTGGGLVGRVSGSGAYAYISDSSASTQVYANYGGGLAGYAYKSVEINRVHASGDVDGQFYNGGLIGYVNKATITNARADGRVVASDSYAGGLIGRVDDSSRLAGVVATGDVQGGDSVGGLIGAVNPPVSTSYLTFNIDGSQTSVTEALATGEVTATGDYVGGLVGLTYNLELINSFASGNVSGARYVGGLVGDANTGSIIEKGLAVGAATGTSSVGGLVGWNDGGSYTANHFANDRGNFNAIGTNHSGGTQSPAGTEGASLVHLQCPVDQNDTACTIGTLYVNWQSYSLLIGPLWDFGTPTQLPGLNIDGVIYRDGDGDGTLD